ncbi:MAG: ribokinase [Bacteroidales bacterium]|nr:ribokinase [Bacteroidales bacterium]
MTTALNRKIVVVGSSNTDMVIRSPRMPRPGETVLGGEFMMNPGGKGANQAVAAARLGGEVTFIAKVGDDVFGKQTLENLAEEGIVTDHIGVAADVPSGVALINVDASGENSISVASGANSTLSTTDIDAAEEAIAAAAIVLLQLEVPVSTVAYAAAVAKRHGVPVVLNPAPAPNTPLPAELLQNVDIIIPNRTEMELITGVGCDRPVEDGVERLRELGVATVVVTLGSEGSLVCGSGNILKVDPFKVAPVDTTAAGDTFCAALCVGIAEGMPLDRAALFGNLAASVTVTRSGAQPSLPLRSEIDALIAGGALG